MAVPNVLPPRCAARFVVTGPLGKGGAGMVYRAIQVDLERPVAVKVLHREVLAEASLVERFKIEARITAQLNHPSIVRILDHDVEDGIPWIALELLPGPTLRQHLAPGPIAWTEAFQIAIQIAGALDVAHAAGVLHRDVKPDNVLGAGTGRWKVTDFGIAKTDSYDLERTQSGMLMGTPAYLAPEHITSGVAEPASDVYALGITLFEMITGTRPFVDVNPIRLLEKHLSQEAPPPSTLVSGISREVDAIVARALAKTPADRWGSAGEFRRAMAELLGPDASIEMSKLEVAAMGRSQSSVAVGHLPPAKATGGLTSDGVRDASGVANLTAALREHKDRELSGVRDIPLLPSSERTSSGSRGGAASAKASAPPAGARVTAPGSRPPSRAAGFGPMIAVSGALLLVGMLLWPRGTVKGPDAPNTSARPPSPAASPHIAAAELAQMRAQLDEVIRQRGTRDTDFTMMAGYMNPMLSNYTAAETVARSLLKSETDAYATLQRLASRLTEEYPSIDRVPDSERMLYARIFATRCRAWCWLENTRITLEVLVQVQDARSPLHGRQAAGELEKRAYPPGLVVPLFDALDAIAAALDQCARQPETIDADLGELFLELNYVSVNIAWRTWDPNVLGRVDRRVSKLRQACAQLAVPYGPAIGRVAMSLWDFGSADGSQLKFARERLNSALKELVGLSASCPGLAVAQRRVERDIFKR